MTLESTSTSLGQPPTETELQALINATSGVSLLIDVGGFIVCANTKATVHFNIELEQLVGRNIFSLFDETTSAGRKSIVRQAAQERKPVVLEDERDGVHYRHSGVPVLDGDGIVRRIAVFTEDITERKMAEMALRASEEQYRILAENTADTVWQLDHQMRFMYVNCAYTNLTGFTREEILNRSVMEFFTPEGRATVVGMMAQRKENEAQGKSNVALRFEVQHIHKHGEPFWVEINSNPTYDQSGAIVAFNGVMREINERKTAELALKASEERFRVLAGLLQQTNEQKKLLLAAVSHDLRQPVHALGLLVGSWDLKDLSRYHKRRVRLVNSQLTLLSDMLRSLLDNTQLELGLYTVRSTRINVHTLLTEVFEEYATSARSKGLKALMEISGAQNIEVMSDRGLFGRMVSNLLSNAVKYTTSGHILLCAHLQPDGALCIAVEDTGVGIAADLQAAIVVPFVRINPNFGDGSGMGIGLSIVDRGARLLGMELSYTSQASRGSSFSLRLSPKVVLRRAHPIVPKRVSPVATSADIGRKQIVMVEDDEAIYAFTQELLESWGHTVLGAHGVQEILEKINASEFKPDLLLTDYKLGSHENGIDCINAVRAMVKRVDLPAILITGDLLVTLADDMPKANVKVFNKPLRIQELRRAIADMFA